MVFSNPPCHPTIVPANLSSLFPSPAPSSTPTPAPAHNPIRTLGSRGRSSFWRCLSQNPEPKIEPAALPKK